MRLSATAKIKIKATPKLIQTIALYKKGLQFCINIAWNKKIRNNVKLHPFVYKHLRNIGLHSQLAISCIKQATGYVKKAKTKPVINKCSVRYNFPRCASFKNNVLRIATIKGRQSFDVVIPDCFKEYFTWDMTESLLRIDKKGRCFFLFTFAKEVQVNSTKSQTRVLGLDFGINKLLVTSDRQFFHSSITKKIKSKYFALRQRLQAKGTRSSKRLLKKISGKERRFMAIENHKISKEVVSTLNSGDTIVMEDLKGIRKQRKGKRFNRWLSNWSFFQLQSFITYKAQRLGINVVSVNPMNTSKTCSRCGSLNTIRNSGFVRCSECCYHLDSDLNASYNIAKLYTSNIGKVAITQPHNPCDDVKGLLTTATEHRVKYPCL